MNNNIKKKVLSVINEKINEKQKLYDSSCKMEEQVAKEKVEKIWNDVDQYKIDLEKKMISEILGKLL